MDLTRDLGARAGPLDDERDLGPLLDRAGDARIVMLGEASHGTSEYYRWRTRITQQLVEEKVFSFVAVEGDWPECQRVDRHVRDLPGRPETAREALSAFTRWPTWMWANEEAHDLAVWLRGHNEGHRERMVGFHGLDVYSLWESLDRVMAYLQRTDGDAADAARRAMACFEPYARDVQEYAASTRWLPEGCEADVVEMLAGLRRRAVEEGSFRALDAEQNGWVVRNAERYYRAMVRSGPGSWNLRDTHMMDTLDRLLRHYGPDAKGIVWAHNTHVGDASATDMAEAGMTNLGQLARERHGRDRVVLVGFGSYEGTVVAARAWDAPMERMPVPPAREGSLEDLLHRRLDGGDALLLLDGRPGRPALDHRAIGVVYHPQAERWGNYVPTDLAARYDAFLHLDRTQAVHPLPVPVVHAEVDETYPTGY